MKTALVDSYVGAIAFGYLLGEGAEQVAMVITAPFSEWAALKELHRVSPQSTPDPGFRLQTSLSPLFHCVFFVLIGLALLR